MHTEVSSNLSENENYNGDINKEDNFFEVILT